jgi:lysozyme
MRTRTKVATLGASAVFIVSLAMEESFVGRAYQDIVGVWTIGFGTTENVKPGDTITPVQALQRKLSDVQKFEGALKSCVRVPLAQNEYDSFLSLAYNIGPTAFCKSTLVAKLNAGDYSGACKEILRWNKAGGRVVKGLVNRREREYKHCMGENAWAS